MGISIIHRVEAIIPNEIIAQFGDTKSFQHKLDNATQGSIAEETHAIGAGTLVASFRSWAEARACQTALAEMIDYFSKRMEGGDAK